MIWQDDSVGVTKGELVTLLKRYMTMEVDLNPLPTSPEYIACKVSLYFDGHLLCEDTGSREIK